MKPRTRERDGRGRGDGAGWLQRVQLPPVGLLLLYGGLAAAAAVMGALYLLLPGQPLVQDFGPEITINALGILVTLTFVQRLMNTQERRRRLRGSVGGLRRGARALTRLQDAWATTLKGCYVGVPAERSDATADLFLDGCVEKLMNLDPAAPRSADGTRALAWLTGEVEAARETLRAVTRQYAGGFDVEYLEALDELIDDPFLDLVAELDGRGVAAQEWRLRINSARGARARHFSQLRRVLDLHNEIAGEAARVRGATLRTHELGIVVAGDVDLRVPTEVPDGWWSATPQAGTLRQAADAPPLLRARAAAGEPYPLTRVPPEPPRAAART
jgi:hypothetical protein